MRYQPEVAATVIGFAGFQLLEAWNANAPTLAEVRQAHPDDLGVAQRLMDADLMVGGLSVILGVSVAVLTGDLTAMIVMLVIFGSVSLWWHQVQRAESR